MKLSDTLGLSFSSHLAFCSANSHWYLFVSTSKTLSEAKSLAKGMTYGATTGHLATINGAAEQACAATASGSSDAWLGGSLNSYNNGNTLLPMWTEDAAEVLIASPLYNNWVSLT